MKRCILFAALLSLIACRQEADATATTPATAPVTETSASAPAPAPATPPPAAATCTPAQDRLCPVDEAASDPSFESFRQELRTAVQQRDIEKLLTMVDPGIRISFGDGGGADEFRKLLQRPDTPLWTVLDKVLSLGGSFRGEGDARSFWAPYVYANWPESIDPFQHVAAIRPGAPLRATPADDGGIVTTIDWTILELLPTDTPSTAANWLQVKSPGGAEAWVRTSDVHSPVGYRAGFQRSNGQWKMNAFVAGD